MSDASSERILILAPVGRDGPASAELLRKAGLAGQVCVNLGAVGSELERGAAALFVAEEALFGQNLTPLQSWMRRQPAWSDLPVIVLTSHHQDRRVAAWRQGLVASLANVALLERPVHPITLTSTLQAAVRARKRQYEVRTLLEARERAAQELQGKVMEATDELRKQMIRQAHIEETLRQTQKIEALGQLTGGVAHDFNNLLMVISAGLDLIERRKNDERFPTFVDNMRNAVQRGAGLTRQLLTFARRQPLKPRPIDLARQLSNMRDLIDRSLGDDLHLVMEFDINLWPVKADPSELELVVLNLVFNARDAMPKGGTIVVHGANCPNWRPPDWNGSTEQDKGQTGDFVRLVVSDTGTGMTAEVQARAIEPFFTTKEVGKGSGLGLAQAYGFARSSGGFLQIDSEVGRGTSVALMLPRCDTYPFGENQPVDRRRSPAKEEVSHYVLVVEDDEEVAMFVSEMLRDLGYEVLRTGSALGALGALANDRRIDLVFSDIMMAGEMDGIGLAREVKARRPHLPVLLTSGNPEAARKHVEADGFLVLAKPYRLEDLSDAVARALEARSQGANRPPVG